jgi:hypothetical protein
MQPMFLDLLYQLQQFFEELKISNLVMTMMKMIVQVMPIAKKKAQKMNYKMSRSTRQNRITRIPAGIGEVGKGALDVGGGGVAAIDCACLALRKDFDDAFTECLLVLAEADNDLAMKHDHRQKIHKTISKQTFTTFIVAIIVRWSRRGHCWSG